MWKIDSPAIRKKKSTTHVAPYKRNSREEGINMRDECLEEGKYVSWRITLILCEIFTSYDANEDGKRRLHCMSRLACLFAESRLHLLLAEPK